MADINSGIIFSLLPANSVALGLSMYRNEHVNFQLKFEFLWNFFRKFPSLCILYVFVEVCHRSGCNRIRFPVFHLLAHLALLVLLLCKYHVRTNAINWRRCLQFKLVWLSNWRAEIPRSDYAPGTWNKTILWSGLDSVHFGDLWTRKLSIWFYFDFKYLGFFLPTNNIDVVPQLFRSSCSYYLIFRSVSVK